LLSHQSVYTVIYLALLCCTGPTIHVAAVEWCVTSMGSIERRRSATVGKDTLFSSLYQTVSLQHVWSCCNWSETLPKSRRTFQTSIKAGMSSSESEVPAGMYICSMILLILIFFQQSLF